QSLLLVGLGAGIARDARSDGQGSEAGDGGLEEGVHAPFLKLPLPPPIAARTLLPTVWIFQGGTVQLSDTKSRRTRFSGLFAALPLHQRPRAPLHLPRLRTAY